MEFKKEEIMDLIINTIGLTILSGIFNLNMVVIYFIVYAVSTFFKILVEKITAEKFELNAFYDFDYNFFIISLVLALMSMGSLVFPMLGFIKAEQKSIKRIGKWYSNITFNEKGWISLMGILTNAFLIFISLILFDLQPVFFQKMIDVNTLMMIFSMIPFAKFEGSNILWWNRFLWIGVLVCAMIFAFMAVFKINVIISLIFISIAFVLVFIFWENVFRWY